MEIIYISHPFTGDEKKNRKDARHIAAILASLYPDTVFLNPLDALHSVEDASLDYPDALGQALEVMKRCDGVILTGNWTRSEGCMAEVEAATSQGLPIYIGGKQYICFRGMKGGNAHESSDADRTSW